MEPVRPTNTLPPDDLRDQIDLLKRFAVAMEGLKKILSDYRAQTKEDVEKFFIDYIFGTFDMIETGFSRVSEHYSIFSEPRSLTQFAHCVPEDISNALRQQISDTAELRHHLKLLTESVYAAVPDGAKDYIGVLDRSKELGYSTNEYRENTRALLQEFLNNLSVSGLDLSSQPVPLGPHNSPH